MLLTCLNVDGIKGGVVEKGEKEIKQQLTRLIEYYSTTLPDKARVVDDLWKFARMHGRRSYQLIRFCVSPDSEYKKVQRSMVSFSKPCLHMVALR